LASVLLPVPGAPETCYDVLDSDCGDQHDDEQADVEAVGVLLQE
jgi:hypothetical protein